jgi:hypothetical protein
MSTFNTFQIALEDAFVQLLQSPTAEIPAGTHIATGKSEDINLLPRIVVATGNLTEAIYQSGIYRANVEIICKTSIDAGDRDSASELFGKVADMVQRTNLRQDLIDTGKVYVHGLMEPTIDHNAYGDREWADTIRIQVVGMSA